MTAEEKQKIRHALAMAVYKAHAAYIAANNAAYQFGLDCRNPQHIVYADGRGKVRSVLINGGNDEAP